jgi:hypothetical protein
MVTQGQSNSNGVGVSWYNIKMNWIQKTRARIVKLFWGTHDNKYIVTDQGLKILFRKEGGYTKKPRNLL